MSLPIEEKTSPFVEFCSLFKNKKFLYHEDNCKQHDYIMMVVVGIFGSDLIDIEFDALYAFCIKVVKKHCVLHDDCCSEYESNDINKYPVLSKLILEHGNDFDTFVSNVSNDRVNILKEMKLDDPILHKNN